MSAGNMELIRDIQEFGIIGNARNADTNGKHSATINYCNSSITIKITIQTNFGTALLAVHFFNKSTNYLRFEQQ
jgi:hypothetical protein